MIIVHLNETEYELHWTGTEYRDKAGHKWEQVGSGFVSEQHGRANEQQWSVPVHG